MEFLDFSSPEQKREYESFVENHTLGGFTQSLPWCTVKESWMHEAIIVRNDQQEIISTMLVLIKRIPVLGTAFLYSPRGPLCDFQDEMILSELLEGVKILANKYHAYLFKCDPYILSSDTASIQALNSLGLTYQQQSLENTVQCRCNYVLDIKGLTEEETFHRFNKKWRYNIRLAERKEVICKVFDKNKITDSELNDFYHLMQETGLRNRFSIRSKEYFFSMLNSLGSHCRLYLCYFQGNPVSGAIATQYAGKTCYVYGASSSSARDVMPNYLMQWRMIQWAISNRDFIYDFQGIPYYYDETHPNYGVFRFKKGFNGRVVEYAGEFDYVFSPMRKKLVDCFYRITFKH